MIFKSVWAGQNRVYIEDNIIGPFRRHEKDPIRFRSHRYLRKKSLCKRCQMRTHRYRIGTRPDPTLDVDSSGLDPDQSAFICACKRQSGSIGFHFALGAYLWACAVPILDTAVVSPITKFLARFDTCESYSSVSSFWQFLTVFLSEMANKPDHWSDEETYELIAIWSDDAIQRKLESSYHKWTSYSFIADKLREKGFQDRDANSVLQKLKRLKTMYRKKKHSWANLLSYLHSLYLAPERIQ